MDKKVGIIVLNWNGKEDTAKCLRSLEKLTYPVEVILVDNGSTDGSQAFFKEHFPKYTLLETGENLGYAGGNNVGIQYGLDKDLSFFFLLNNDTVVDPEIIQAFLAGFADETVGILGAKIYLMDEPVRFDHFGGQWNPRKLSFDYVGYKELDDGKSWEEAFDLDYVCGAGIMIRREVFEKVGLLDPRFFLFWEETDFCFAAKRAGFAIKSCPEAKLWHKVSASFTGGKPHAAYFFWRNRLLWIERNFSGSRRLLYLTKSVGGNLLSLYGMKCLRTVQLFFQNLIGADSSRNRERLIRYNAALFGIEDYLLRRFGPGRSKKFTNCH